MFRKEINELLIRHLERIICISKTGHLDEINIAGLQVGNGSIYYLIQSIKGWINVMERFDGSLDFNQNWTAYRNGIGDAEEGEFWLGNEKLHLLTNRTGQVYRLRVEVFAYQYYQQ